jgi:hypothetical protein
MEWPFDSSTLPPGATVTAAELKFKTFRGGSNNPTHASFSLYDLKMEAWNSGGSGGNEGPLYSAMTNPNKIVDGSTVTVNNEEVSTINDAALVQAVQAALTSNRNFLTLGVKRNPEFSGGIFSWDITTVAYQTTATLQVWFTAPQYNITIRNDLDGTAFGQVTYQINGGTTQNANPDVPVSLYWGDNLNVSANTGKYQYPQQNPNNWMFSGWDGGGSDRVNPKTILVTGSKPVVAYFKPVFNVSVQNSMDGQSWGQLTYNGGPVSSGYTQQDIWRNTTVSLSCPSSYIDGNRTWTFYSWQDGTTSTSRSISVNVTQTYVAKFKATMSLNDPSTTDAKNQRRSAAATTLTPTGWFTVYESMGDVWLAFSGNNGQTWVSEERLNNLIGQASHPTLSNVLVVNGTSFVALSWLEQNGSTTELHLQTKLFSQNWWGWNPSLSARSSDNHRLLSEFSYPAPISTARPVLQLDYDGSNKILTVAYEQYSGGIVAGAFTISADLGSISPDGNDHPLRILSTNGSDSNPVIVSYPGAYGYGARKYVYYLAGGYASGRRVAQYQWSGSSTSLITGGYNDYTYTSLQGGINPLAASFALVTEGLDISGNPFVNQYVKETYLGNNAPHLSTSYTGMRKPTIMVEKNSNFGSPTTEVDLASGSVWWKAIGSSTTQIGTTIDGILARDLVSSGDRAVVLCRNTQTPDFLQYYVGSGSLPKTDGTSAVDLKFVRQWQDNAIGKIHTMVLDFSGATVDVLDTLMSGRTLCAVRIGAPASDNSIVRQIDSLMIPLQVGVIRGGKTRCLSGSTSWTSLSVSSLSDFQFGDVLTFGLPEETKPFNSYTIVSLRHNGVSKSSSPEDILQKLAEHQPDMSVYPNPFNPSTQIQFVLPRISMTKLVIYDVLGRVVSILANGEFDAGYHNIVWDPKSNGQTVASGIYFARLQVTDVKSKEVYTQTNKLLLTR